jgi:hypothetical protein
MSWGGIAVGVGTAVIGGMSANSASKKQQQASREASMLEMMAAAQQREDLAPWMQAGGQAQSELSRRLGLGGVGSGGRTSMGLETGLSRDQVREQLLSQYTKAGSGQGSAPGDGLGYWQTTGQGGDVDTLRNEWIPIGPPGSPSQVDEAGLSSAIDRYYQEQDELRRQAESDPTYGSLLRPYRDGEEFSFTGEDLENEPGYKFGLDQGTQGINRAQAARGKFLSGAAMKELDRYTQDYAGTKFNDAFGRAQSTWNTNLGAYNGNRDRVYNFLSGVSTLGQNSAARVGAGSQQAAGSAADNALAAGNAGAAADVATGNAWQSALNQGMNSINSAGGWNQLLAKDAGKYTGSSTNPLAPNYENSMDRGVTF